MVRREAYPSSEDDGDEDETVPAPRSKPAPAPAPAPAVAPVAAPVKKKKTLNRQVYVSNEDPDADPVAAPAEKEKKKKAAGGAMAPTPAPQAKKRDVVAGEVAPSAKSSLVSARSGSGDEDEDEEGTTSLFVGVNSGPSTKPATVADEEGSDDDDDDDDEEDTTNEFGDSVSAHTTEEPQAATPTPHPKPQPPTTSATDAAAAPVVKKTDEFLTELLEDVQFLTRGTKKKKSSQRVNMFSFSEHLKEEGLSLTKAEFALDPAVPVELAGALTTPCGEMEDDDDGKRKTIKSIDMPFDVFLSGDEDKFFANLCDQDPWGRQKLMAASIIATKETETPKQFCYFVRLNITAPRDTEEEPNAEAVAAWPAFETFIGEEKREVVLSFAETVVKAAMKQLQDAVFFCPQQFISAYTPIRTRGKAKASATAEPAAKSHVYKRFEQINDKVIAFAFNITGGPVPKKRSLSTKAAGPKQKTLVQLANRQAETASKHARRPVAHTDDDEEEEEEDERPPPSKKSKLAPPAPPPVANDDVLMNDGDDEEESIDTCELLISGLAKEIATKQKTMKLLKEFHKYLAER